MGRTLSIVGKRGQRAPWREPFQSHSESSRRGSEFSPGIHQLYDIGPVPSCLFLSF